MRFRNGSGDGSGSGAGLHISSGRRAVFATCLMMALTAPLAARAQSEANWPDRSIKLVVPQPPGGGFDAIGRIVADRLGPLLKQTVVVDNRPGAGTRAGTDFVAKAAPDGYTLVVGALPNIALNAGLYKDLPYDPERDFTPVGLVASFGYTLVARNDLPQKTLADIIAFARNNPEKLSYASGGNGTGQHILMAVLTSQTGVKMLHVPYRGAQAAYLDVMAGRVDLFFDNASTARPLVESGKVRAIAVSSVKRLPFHPDTPTVVETGVAPLQMESWFGVFAPKKTPAPIVARLRAEMRKIAAMPDMPALWAKLGASGINPDVAEMEAMVSADIAKWKKEIAAAGLFLND